VKLNKGVKLKDANQISKENVFEISLNKKTASLCIILGILSIFCFSSCSREFGGISIQKPEQPVHNEILILNPTHSLGQTFVPNYDGLQAVTLYLEPRISDSGNDTVEGTLFLQIFNSPQDLLILSSSTLPLTEIRSPGYYRCQFPPIQYSNGKDYYFLININGKGEIGVGSSSGDSYLNGSLYKVDNSSSLQGLTPIPEAQDAQLAFLLEYRMSQLVSGLFQEGLNCLLVIAVSLFIFVVPGWALFTFLFPSWTRLYLGEKLGLAIGVSLAIYPILMLWTNLFKLNLGSLYAWLPPLLGSGYLFWKNIFSRRYSLLDWKLIFRPRVKFYDLAFLIIAILIFATRFWAIRRFDFPMWGDSYQHSLISHLISDNGGLFQSWQPYAELVTFTYHFGFHAFAAVFHWITHISIPQAVLWTGQIINGLAVICLFPLAMRIKRNPWCGLFAVFLAGFLLPMPMYYTNWGRYTQLAGQAILPAAIYLVWVNLEKDRLDWRLFLLSWISLAGLSLTHYRVLIFVILFYPAYFLFSLWRKQHARIEILNIIKKIFWSGIGAALLFLPWFLHTFSGRITYNFFHQLISKPSNIVESIQYNPIGNLFVYLPPIIWISLPVLIAWGFWRRKRNVALICLWWFMIFLATNPQWLSLPGGRSITNFAIFIAVYIPASLILGEAAVDIMKRISVVCILPITSNKKLLSKNFLLTSDNQNGTITEYYRSKKIIKYAFLIFMIVLGFWGAYQRLGDIHIAQHTLVTRPDLRAASWIQKNLPPDSRFLVNSFFAFGGASVVGSDGGWWLPLLADRSTTLPPLNYVSEQGPRQDYIQWINGLTSEVEQKGIDHPDTLILLEERGVTHIYVGQQQGSVNSDGKFINVDELLNSEHFQAIYHQDRVWVFELVP